MEDLAESNSSLAVELCDLLTSYEMEGLLQAHDSIALLTDRSYTNNVITHVKTNSIPTTPSNMHTMLAKNSLTNVNNLKNDTKGYSSSTEDIKKVCDALSSQNLSF